MSDVPVAFNGEVQLRRWSESSTQGVQVTFALADASELEPLKAKSGKRFACVLVEIGDDELPVAQPKPREPLGQNCLWAVGRCKEKEFWAFLNHEKDSSQWVRNEAQARDALLQLCGVDSRKELDDPEGGKHFIAAIKGPYQRWLASRGGAWRAGT